jgi:hypothetical protein
MFFNFDTDTLEALSEGVVLLDRNGQITDFNESAKPFLTICNKASEKIKSLVISTMRENTKKPTLVDVLPAQEASNFAHDVRLCSDGKNGFALLFTKKRFAVDTDTHLWQKNNILQMMGDDIRHDFTEIIQEFDSIMNTPGSTPLESLTARAQHLRSMFVAMDQLSRLAQVSSMDPGDRISVPDILSSAIAALQYSHCDYHKDVGAGLSAKDVGAVYGSASWIRCALTGLLQGMEIGAPRRSQINLTVRQNGSFLTISAKNTIASHQRSPSTCQAELANETKLHLVASTRVPLARRIIEMHGGTLRVTDLDPENTDRTFAIESFTLQLPTGRPFNSHAESCDNCIFSHQAMAYAVDLALMTPSTPQPANVSEEEFALLNSIATAFE